MHVCSVSLGVSYYGNREAEKGLDGTVEAVTSATKTLERIHNTVSGHFNTVIIVNLVCLLPFDLNFYSVYDFVILFCCCTVLPVVGCITVSMIHELART